MLIEVPWSEFKDHINDSNLRWIYVTEGVNYATYASYDGFIFKSYIRNGSADYTDFNDNWKALGNKPLQDFDESGRKITRQAVTEKGWHYDLVFLERKTSTNEYYIKDRNGNDRGTITITRYDVNDNITTTNSLVVKSKIVVEFDHDIEIMEAEFFQVNTASNACRLWITAAGHIPANLGGSKTFVEGLPMHRLKEYYHIDGRSSKYVKKDTVNYSHRWELIEKHTAGLEHEYTLAIGFYKA